VYIQMKKMLGISAAAILGCLLFTLPAAAGAILLTYNGPGPNTVNTINLPGVGNVYSFPYNVNGWPVMCDDAQTDVSAPLTWWADVHYLPTDITQMKFYSEFTTQSAALTAYEEAAIIFYEGATSGNVAWQAGTQTGTTSAAEGNVAVWSLFTPSASDGDSAEIIAAAASVVAAGTFNYSNVVFFTPDPSLTLNPPAGNLKGGLGASQEFIGLASQVEAPEPTTYAMFGAGLLGLGWLGRRRRA